MEDLVIAEDEEEVVDEVDIVLMKVVEMEEVMVQMEHPLVKRGVVSQVMVNDILQKISENQQGRLTLLVEVVEMAVVQVVLVDTETEEMDEEPLLRRERME